MSVKKRLGKSTLMDHPIADGVSASLRSWRRTLATETRGDGLRKLSFGAQTFDATTAISSEAGQTTRLNWLLSCMRESDLRTRRDARGSRPALAGCGPSACWRVPVRCRVEEFCVPPGQQPESWIARSLQVSFWMRKKEREREREREKEREREREKTHILVRTYFRIKKLCKNLFCKKSLLTDVVFQLMKTKKTVIIFNQDGTHVSFCLCSNFLAHSVMWSNWLVSNWPTFMLLFVFAP